MDQIHDKTGRKDGPTTDDRGALARGHLRALLERQRERCKEVGATLGQALHTGGNLRFHAGAVLALAADCLEIRQTTQLIDQQCSSIEASLRQMETSLLATTLARQGLLSGLEELMAAAGARCQLETRVSWRTKEKSFGPMADLGLYRVVQEAAVNAVRHARATSLQVCVSRSQEMVVVTIGDNGAGIAPGSAARGRGIRSMSGWARELGGYLTIRTTPSAGTMVSVVAKISRDGGVDGCRCRSEGVPCLTSKSPG